jgi:adenylate kinase
MIISAARLLSRQRGIKVASAVAASSQNYPKAAAVTAVASSNVLLSSDNANISPLQMITLQRRLFHPSDENLEGDLDELSTKFMDIPEDDFAEGCRFLHQVALGKKLEVEKIVSKRQHIVNFRDYDRRTALHIAASEGHLDLCLFLVKQGARVNRSDRWGGSPLDDAHRHRHIDCANFLQSVGGKFGSTSQATNFITAASEGDVAEVKMLLRMGDIDINQCDYDKRTALHLAAGEGHIDVVQYLCMVGANVNVLDRWNNRPLDDAQSNGHEECVKILQKFGAKYGRTESSSFGRQALIDLFEQYCKKRNGEMSLDWHDVSDLLDNIGQKPTDEAVRKLFSAADDNNDGLIGKDEFLDHSDLFLQGRPARIILVVGGPGSGKGMLSERLVKECGVVHLSSGDMLREEVQEGTHLGKQVDEIMKSGGLVSSAIIVTLMQKKMRAHPGKRVLLDGFPRSAENAKDLVTLCGRPELALHLECDDTVLIERIIGRGKKSSSDGVAARADDNIDTALQRIRTYHKYHKLTLDFLREEHVPIVNLDCSATPDGVWEQLKAVGRLMRIPVASSRNSSM